MNGSDRFQPSNGSVRAAVRSVRFLSEPILAETGDPVPLEGEKGSVVG